MATFGTYWARWVAFTSKTPPTCVPLQRHDILSDLRLAAQKKTMYLAVQQISDAVSMMHNAGR